MSKLQLSPFLALVACSTAKPAPPPAQPVPVQFVVVEKRDVPLYIEAVGSVDGYVNADIRARVRGYLEKQLYKDGGPVKIGQTLFTIEATEYQAAAQSAGANLSRAKVLLAKAELDKTRNEGLLKAGMISQQDVDNAVSAVNDAKAQISAAQAQVQSANLNLSYTQIKSPIDGVAGIALVRVGNLVGQDQPTLLTTVSQLDPIRVNFPLSEVDYAKYPSRFAHLDTHDLAWAKKEFTRLDSDPTAAGVEIVLADGSTYAHRGALVAANRQIDANSGTTQMQALVSNSEGILRPGEYARVRIRRENEGKDVLVVPEKALVSVQGTYSIAIIGEGNKVSIKPIQLGPATGGFRIVTSGLVGGEKIVVDGIQKVTDGATVIPTPAPPPGASSGAGSGQAPPPATGSGSGSAKAN